MICNLCILTCDRTLIRGIVNFYFCIVNSWVRCITIYCSFLSNLIPVSSGLENLTKSIEINKSTGLICFLIYQLLCSVSVDLIKTESKFTFFRCGRYLSIYSFSCFDGIFSIGRHIMMNKMPFLPSDVIDHISHQPSCRNTVCFKVRIRNKEHTGCWRLCRCCCCIITIKNHILADIIFLIRSLCCLTSDHLAIIIYCLNKILIKFCIRIRNVQYYILSFFNADTHLAIANSRELTLCKINIICSVITCSHSGNINYISLI